MQGYDMRSMVSKKGRRQQRKQQGGERRPTTSQVYNATSWTRRLGWQLAEVKEQLRLIPDPGAWHSLMGALHYALNDEQVSPFREAGSSPDEALFQRLWRWGSSAPGGGFYHARVNRVAQKLASIVADHFGVYAPRRRPDLPTAIAA